MRLAIRGFAPGRQLVFEDSIEIAEDLRDRVMQDLVLKHARAMAAHDRHIIEIEFLDEPDREKRFFRFGTDSRMMTKPVALDLKEN